MSLLAGTVERRSEASLAVPISVHGRVSGWGWPVRAERAVATAGRSALMYVVVAGPVLSVWPA